MIKYFKTVLGDMKRSLADNINILWALLIASSGVFIGMFLTDHVEAVGKLNAAYSLSGLAMFALVIAGCLNIVWAFSVMKTRSLVASIYASLTTLVILVCGFYWIYCFINNYRYVTTDIFSAFPGIIRSLTCVTLAMVCPLLGTIASFATINWKYKKDKF